jgi:UDP-glucose-4-epimerase GalE
MHFAALAEVAESVAQPLLYYRTNVANTIGLLEVMRTYNVRSIVFSSSCAVYGVPPAVPIREDMPLAPISPYGRTKLAIEWVLRDCATAWGLRAVSLRYFNAAGAAEDGSIGEDHEPESHLIPRVLQVALGQAAEVTVFGNDYPTADGTCVRDYVHVEDLAAAHRLAIERMEDRKQQPRPGLLACNVGTGRGHSVKEVIEAAREITGHPIPISSGPRREGDPPALFADPGRIARELVWKPRFTAIRDLVHSAWRWHRTHPQGFRASGKPSRAAAMPTPAP